MNIPFAAAALLLAVAFFAHLFVGTRETLSQKPDEENTTQQGMRNWMQAVCAFQLVSVDLLLLAATAACLRSHGFSTVWKPPLPVLLPFIWACGAPCG